MFLTFLGRAKRPYQGSEWDYFVIGHTSAFKEVYNRHKLSHRGGSFRVLSEGLSLK